jgi:PAS domain S-box-containing protein
MLFTFFQNITLIITFTFIYIKFKNLIIKKTNSKFLWISGACIIASVLSTSTMFNPLLYGDFIFDLRSVPIFLISYKMGLKAGFVTSMLPALYRWNMGGTGAMQGILWAILLPALLGSMLNKRKCKSHPIALIDTKAIIPAFLVFSIIREGLNFATLDISFGEWINIGLHVTTFSAIALMSMVIIINDANKNEQWEKTLSVSEERYKKLVELLPDAILAYRGDTIVYANTAAIELMGLNSADEVINSKLESLISTHPDYTNLGSIIKDFQQGKITSSLSENKFIIRDGSEIDVEIRGVSFISDGEFFIINVIRNITSHKKAQELERKIIQERKLLEETIEYDKLKVDFFANLSHELKTPINLIFSAIQLMEFDIKNNFQESSKNLSTRIRVLKQNCNRMVKLANNLIDITKIDSGYFSLDMQNCNIVSIVEDVTLSVAEYIENSNIKLIFDTDVEEKIVAVDPNAIERIILNLLSNAVKFTKPDNEILVNIHDEEENIIISVKDKGQGIPKDKIDVIFDRFRQGDKSLNRKQEGSGIGLSLVKSLVEIHGGEIYVISNPNEGSEFIIKMPARIICDGPEKSNLEELRDNHIETIRVEFSDIYSLN